MTTNTEELDKAVGRLTIKLGASTKQDAQDISTLVIALTSMQARLAVAEGRLEKVEGLFELCDDNGTDEKEWFAKEEHALLIGPTFLEAIDSIALPTPNKGK